MRRRRRRMVMVKNCASVKHNTRTTQRNATQRRATSRHVLSRLAVRRVGAIPVVVVRHFVDEVGWQGGRQLRVKRGQFAGGERGVDGGLAGRGGNADVGAIPELLTVRSGGRARVGRVPVPAEHAVCARHVVRDVVVRLVRHAVATVGIGVRGLVRVALGLQGVVQQLVAVEWFPPAAADHFAVHVGVAARPQETGAAEALLRNVGRVAELELEEAVVVRRDDNLNEEAVARRANRGRGVPGCVPVLVRICRSISAHSVDVAFVGVHNGRATGVQAMGAVVSDVSRRWDGHEAVAACCGQGRERQGD